MPTSLILPPARIAFREQQPVSLDFGDIYFASDGRGETKRVFIGPLELDALFRSSGLTSVRIGELGFGTGLNFLAVCEKFLASAPDQASLDYLAFESHPLAHKDFERIAHAHSPPFSLTEELLAALPGLLAGWHKRSLCGGRIRLSLYHGNALRGMAEFSGRCHAWLLDGFDPKHNPDMWSRPLLEAVVMRSHASARLATFSAQGELRRRLESLGLDVSRVDQRPYKRHSLLARLGSSFPEPPPAPQEVGIVGAGFAGLFTAHLLATRGISVHLFDANPAPMPIAIAHARLGDPSMALTKLRALALGYSNNQYRRLGCKSGVFEVAKNAQDARRLEARAELWKRAQLPLSFLPARDARELTGLPRAGEGLFYPQCHLVDRESLLKLSAHPQISSHRTRVQACIQEGGGWRLEFQGRRSQSFSHLVVCAGAASLALLPKLKAHPISGQMELARAGYSLPVALVGRGFIAPFGNQQVAVGATYERAPLGEDQAREENLARANEWLEDLGIAERPEVQSSWRSTRLFHHDRMPMAGEVKPGLFVNTAHGSAGSLLAPLCAELVASALTRDAPPLTADLAALLRPTR